jgi:hypothetical protein
MTLMRSIKEADYFTQLIYEALVVIERESKYEKIKESMDKVKSKRMFQAQDMLDEKRTVFNSNL